MQLSRALVEASNSFEVVGGDSRIGPLLKNMNRQFIGDDFTKKGRSIDNLTADKVELAAEINMPLCMKVCGDVCESTRYYRQSMNDTVM